MTTTQTLFTNRTIVLHDIEGIPRLVHESVLRAALMSQGFTVLERVDEVEVVNPVHDAPQQF